MTKVHTHTWVDAKTNSTPVISSGRRPVEKDWHWQLWKIINIWMERRYLWPKKNQQQKKRPLPLVVLQSSWRLERTPPQRHPRLGWTGKHRELPSYKYVYLITKVLNQNVEGCRILQISYFTCTSMPTLDVLLYACACRSFWRQPLANKRLFSCHTKTKYFFNKCLRSPWQLQEQLQQCWRGRQRTWTLSDWSTRWECSLWCHSGRCLQVLHIFGLAPGLSQHQAKLRPGLLALLQRWLRSPAVKTRTSTWLALTL